MSSNAQVQTTNDNSIVSKLSSENAGYFKDPCLKMFVEKEQKRSAIINRGYYIRFKAIDLAFESWFTLLLASGYQNSQIISLGAGFDSSYFRLRHINKLPVHCKYIEIDFPSVMVRKALYIKNSHSKIQDFTFSSLPSFNKNIIASSENYLMLGIDLKNIQDLENCLRDINVDFSCPSFFLSECAITYMDTKSSNNLIQWIQCNFPNAAFVAYEQVYPHDGFGIVMRNHFISLGCPLKSLTSYPTKEEQCDRYKKMGWSWCEAISMFDFFDGFPLEEKQRIQSLELFDEYEMWHEKCHHYILLWASQRNEIALKIFNFRSFLCENKFSSKIKWKLNQSHDLLKRFGHQVNLLFPNFLLLSGGFGLVNKKHQRLGGLVLFNLVSMSCWPVTLSSDQDILKKRMFHTVTQLVDGHVVIIGGRSAPKKSFDKVVVLSPIPAIMKGEEKLNKDSFSIAICEKSSMPIAKWKHSASLINISGTECLMIFGGCSETIQATNDCYILNTNLWLWSKVELQADTPSPRHSHSSVTCLDNKVVIACGLSDNETILNSVHVFDPRTLNWTTLQLSGLLPRYSHTSHYYENHVFLIGGVTKYSGFTAGIGLINLKSLNVIELSLPEQDPEYPIILSNHCSYLNNEEIIITGGGGNCFSFGTQFNNKNVIIQIKDLLF